MENRNSNLLACRSCGRAVSRRAKSCPHCGDGKPQGNGCLVAVLITIAVILLFQMLNIFVFPIFNFS